MPSTSGFSLLLAAAPSLLGGALLAASPVPGRADTGVAAADTLQLPAARAETAPEARAPRTVVVPTAEERLMGNLGDLLERQAGVHVLRTGGIGDHLGLSLRGSSEGQVNVYVDGVLQNYAAGSSRFLGDWDLTRVEKVEIYKGLAPYHLPGSPIGGSINIITRKEARATGARTALGGGSFGTLRASAAGAYHGNRWSADGHASRDQSRGDFTYYDDDGTEFRKGRFPDGAPRLGEGDLIRKTRHNNAHGLSEIGGGVSRLIGSGGEAGTQVAYSRLRKQIPAPYANLDSTVTVSAFRESEKLSGRIHGRRSRPGSEHSLDLSAGLIRDLYVDTAGGRGAVGVGYDNDGNDYADFQGALRSHGKLTDGLSLSTLASYGVSGYRYTDHTTGSRYPWLLRYLGEGKLSPAYARGRHAWQADLSGNLSLQEYHGPQAYAYGGERVPREEWKWHGSLQAGYGYRPRDNLRLFLEAGSAYRIPTFLEKFGDRGALLANPSLRPESGLHLSMGLQAKTPRSSLEATAFAREGRRIITLVQNSQSVLLYSNTGDTRTLGTEVRLSASPRPWARTTLDLTLQKAVNLSGGTRVDDYKLIPYRPVAMASLRQAFPYRDWTLTLDGHHQGLAHPNPSNRPSLFDSYSHNTSWQSRWDLGLSFRRRHFLASAAVHNAFDQRNFDFFNFPLPGRSLAAAIQIEF